MSRLIQRATAYKQSLNHQPSHGTVVFYQNDIQGWSAAMPPAKNYVPGCFAIDSQAHTWQSVGGNDNDGAQLWVIL